MKPKPKADQSLSGTNPRPSESAAPQPPPPRAGSPKPGSPSTTKSKARSARLRSRKAGASKKTEASKKSKNSKKKDEADAPAEGAGKPPMSLDRKRTLLAAGAAASLAVFGVILLTSYLKAGEEERALSDPVASRQVLVVREPIASGTTLDELVAANGTSLSSDFVPIEHIAQGSVATVEFVPTESFFNRVASVEIPDGHHQVSFSLDPTRSLGGLIRPGDDISVVASFTARAGFDDLTSVILPSVEVTNVQSSEVLQQSATDDPNSVAVTPSGNYLITVAVEPDELTRLSFAIDYGRIMVAAAVDPDVVLANAGTTPTEVQTLERVLAAAADDLRQQGSGTLAFVEDDGPEADGTAQVGGTADDGTEATAAPAPTADGTEATAAPNRGDGGSSANRRRNRQWNRGDSCSARPSGAGSNDALIGRRGHPNRRPSSGRSPDRRGHVR